jgi:hypothetical protein
MSISEIIEMKKINDPNLSNLIEVNLNFYQIDTDPTTSQRDVIVISNK